MATDNDKLHLQMQMKITALGMAMEIHGIGSAEGQLDRRVECEEILATAKKIEEYLAADISGERIR